MNNTIFNAMMQSTPLGGMQNLIQQYKQFRQTFQGVMRKIKGQI